MLNQVQSVEPQSSLDNPNDVVLIQLNNRLGLLRRNWNVWNPKMDTHQEYLQELWMSQILIPVVNEEVGSPVFRLDEEAGS